MQNTPMATWKMVEEAYDRGNRCNDCTHSRLMSQSHPYGSTTATETWYECDLLEGRAGDSPNDCPDAYAEACANAVEAAEHAHDSQIEERLLASVKQEPDDFDVRR